MKISKIKAIQGNGTFESKFGLMYKFEYVMEDGTLVNANHKTEQSPFKVGDTVEYEITNAEYNNGKVSKPQDNPTQSNGGFNTSDSILYQVCLKGSMDYIIQHNLQFTPDNINSLALEIAQSAKANIGKL